MSCPSSHLQPAALPRLHRRVDCSGNCSVDYCVDGMPSNRGIASAQSGGEGGRRTLKTRIGEELPESSAGAGDRDDHEKSERGKFANTSARFRSISPANGAGPYFARRPRRDRVGSFPGVPATAPGRIVPRASCARAFRETALAGAAATGFAAPSRGASSFGASGNVCGMLDAALRFCGVTHAKTSGRGASARRGQTPVRTASGSFEGTSPPR